MKVRRGLAVVWVVMGLTIAAVPVVVFAGSLAGLQGRVAVRSAQSRFLSLHGLSRSLAVEWGTPMSLVADPETQTVTVRVGCSDNGRILESRDFKLSYRVDMLTGGGVLRVCMTPRGYADPGSNSYTSEGRVNFLRGAHAASVVLFALGQAVQL